MDEMKNGVTENNLAAPEKENTQPTPGTEENAEDTTATAAEEQKKIRENIKKTLEEQRKRLQEANEALSQGKGLMHLETPIFAQDREIKELRYDFTILKGFEYTDAMDSDPNANNAFFITKRQALALFAKAAAKLTEELDMQDIISNLGVTDSVEAVEIATLFFNASRRAGRMRISKLS
jgi:ElaB/YqjD/DUF883 family membrane-anchored ribosome-binding protein